MNNGKKFSFVAIYDKDSRFEIELEFNHSEKRKPISNL